MTPPPSPTKDTPKNTPIMTYCTGGIRCERASALLTQMADAAEDVKPKDIVMVRGGIERYLQTFPTGGYWRGSNFLFDRRFEQRPESKDVRRSRPRSRAYAACARRPAPCTGASTCALARRAACP